MEPSQFKNVLIINDYSMFEHSPVGITTKSIFNNWPYGKLIEVYRYGTSTRCQDNAGIKSIRIPPSMLPLDNIVRHLFHKTIHDNSKTATFQISSANNQSYIEKIKLFIKFISDSIFVCNKNSSVFQGIYKFSPQVIYTSGESLFTLKACLFFSREFNIPIVVHYMDNWRETLYPKTGLTKLLNILFARTLEKVESKMRNGLVISPKMKKAYSLHNPNIKYRVLLNSLPAPLYQPDENRISSKSGKIIFSYFGGLHLNRWESLLDLERCILELNQRGVRAKLLIYSPQQDKAEFSHKYDTETTVFMGYLPHDQVGAAYHDADILVQTESFSGPIIEYIKYSVSTKIPEYMATGKPILCYAPRQLAVSEYIADAKAGIVADNYKDLVRAAYLLATDDNLRARLGQNGITEFCNNHTQDRAREILMKALQ